jgi:hypothetical protein
MKASNATGARHLCRFSVTIARLPGGFTAFRCYDARSGLKAALRSLHEYALPGRAHQKESHAKIAKDAKDETGYLYPLRPLRPLRESGYGDSRRSSLRIFGEPVLSRGQFELGAALGCRLAV